MPRPQPTQERPSNIDAMPRGKRWPAEALAAKARDALEYAREVRRSERRLDAAFAAFDARQQS
jgi:hypothetical protein